MSDIDIKKAVSQFLDANPVPSGKKSVVFIHTENDRVTTGMAFKSGDKWNVDVHTAFNVMKEDHDFTLGVNVIRSF